MRSSRDRTQHAAPYVGNVEQICYKNINMLGYQGQGDGRLSCVHGLDQYVTRHHDYLESRC
jgi:hypothetical protein